jgi:anti-anti-sigma factor
MPGSVRWREQEVEGVIVISLDQGLKGGVEAALKEHIDDLVRQGHLQILIDLQRLPYVDSTELGRLIRCHLAVRQAGGRVRLCALSAKMMTVMRVSRLDTVLDLYASVDDALAAIRGERGKTGMAEAPGATA